MSKKNKTFIDKANFSRRDLLLAGLYSGGGIGLRSLMTGIPIHFLTTRSMSNIDNLQYLVYAASAGGDPVNCNIPGSYIPGCEHPPAFATPVDILLGTETYKVASVWNNLKPEIKAMANFFHLRSGTNSHTEQASVLKLFGAVEPIEGRFPEMLQSAIAHDMSKKLGALLPHPIGLSGPLTYKGRNQNIYSPNAMQALFPPTALESEVEARTYRDKQIASIYKDLKENGTPAQKKFIDNYVISGQKARDIGSNLSDALSSITGNTEADQMKATAALLALKVTTTVGINIGFGGDNHGDSDLSKEANDHHSGVASLNTLYDELKAYGIENKTTFAMLNVFGRTYHRNKSGGRDHHGAGSLLFAFGANIKAGVTGGLKLNSKNKAEAQAVNSITGKVENPDISADDTLKSAAKSLAVSLGVTEDKVNKMINGGKVVRSFLKS